MLVVAVPVRLLADCNLLLLLKMTCGGCSGAVTRVLSKKEGTCEIIGKALAVTHVHCVRRLLGVDSFDVSLEKQEVIVRGTAPYDDVLATIKKTGKEVCYSLSSLVAHRC